MNLNELTSIAITAAQSAGRIIQQSADKTVTVQNKQSGTSQASQVVTAVDLACEKAILKHLMPTCKAYDLALLSEETEDDGSRFEKDYFWCIDPMDGTLSFIQGRPGYSVAIALVAKDGTPFLGVVYDPFTSTLYHATRGQGAFKNNKPWQIQNSNDHLTYVTDGKLANTPKANEIKALLETKAAALGLQSFVEIFGGGSVINAIRVLENAPACMLKFPKKQEGGGCIWDFSATACIYQELGLPAFNFARERLDLNRKAGPYMNSEGVYFASF